jgi:hypothetical protein
LDEIGSLYFTRERFDDFFPGKGSTYPDLHGGVGILFEQASSRGHVQEGKWGELTFPFTIRNHVRTSFSSLEATDSLRTELRENLRSFYREALEEARESDVQGYLCTAPHDPVRLHEFARILDRHQITGYVLAENVKLRGEHYLAGKSLVIPCRQREYRFLRTLFDRPTDFEDAIFYDISAWTLPAAFNLQWTELETPPPPEWFGETLSAGEFPSQPFEPADSDLAYLIDYRSYYAPRTLHRLLREGIAVGVARKPLVAGLEGEPHEAGTLIVPLGVQPERREQIVELLGQAAREDAVVVTGVSSGWSRNGTDLGSDSIHFLELPRILLVIGDGVSPYEAGEIWHLLDHRFEIPVTLVDADRFPRVDLTEYTHVVLPGGSYSAWSDSVADSVRHWVRAGGTVVAQGTAIRWLRARKLSDVVERPAEPVDGDETPADNDAAGRQGAGPPRRPFGEAERDRALKLLSGAIFRVDLDRTHPLGYGHGSGDLHVFRNQRLFLEPSSNPYSTPAAYPDRERQSGHIAGYVPREHLDPLANSASVLAQQVGSGRIILMVDNPNFRGFWYGTNRLFLNALLLGSLVHEPSGE